MGEDTSRTLPAPLFINCDDQTLVEIRILDPHAEGAERAVRDAAAGAVLHRRGPNDVLKRMRPS